MRLVGRRWRRWRRRRRRRRRRLRLCPGHVGLQRAGQPPQGGVWVYADKRPAVLQNTLRRKTAVHVQHFSTIAQRLGERNVSPPGVVDGVAGEDGRTRRRDDAHVKVVVCVEPQQVGRAKLKSLFQVGRAKHRRRGHAGPAVDILGHLALGAQSGEGGDVHGDVVRIHRLMIVKRHRCVLIV